MRRGRNARIGALLLACGVVSAGGLAGTALTACGVFDGDEAAVVPAENFDLACPLYCAVMMRRCRGPATAFLSVTDCMDACAAYPADGPFNAVSGDTLQCRFTFALAARKHTERVFCRNAGATGGVNCR